MIINPRCENKVRVYTIWFNKRENKID